MKKIKITIITICYNSSATIEETLKSVISQDNSNVEYIVVDGKSTDNTLEIINRYKNNIRTVVSESDEGLYDALNKGIGLATGEVIGFLHSDDTYANDHVLSQVSSHFQDPELDACWSDLVYVDRNDPHKIIRYWKSCDYKEGLFKKGWMPPHPTFFVRKRVYEKFGIFDTEFNLQSDFELTMRFISLHKIKTLYYPGISVKMKYGGTSNNSVKNVFWGNMESYRACKKNGLKVSIFFIPMKLLSRIPQFFKKVQKEA